MLCLSCRRGYNAAWIHRCMHAVKSILCTRHVCTIHGGSIVCAEQSMDCLDPYFAHGTIHGLRAQSTDYCAICGSIDCAGQSTDCPNPYFAHNIYIYVFLAFHLRRNYLLTQLIAHSFGGVHNVKYLTVMGIDLQGLMFHLFLYLYLVLHQHQTYQLLARNRVNKSMQAHN